MFRNTPRARRVLGLLALLVLLQGVPSSAAQPSTKPTPAGSVTFGLGPANATGVDGRQYYYFLGGVGAKVSDRVMVLNYSAVPLPLTLYVTDGYNGYSGTNELLDATKTPTDIGSWVRLGSRTKPVVVPARSDGKPGSLLLPFTFVVPPGAEPGDHVGGIVASLSTVGKNAQGFRVNLDQRVAVPIYARVAGTLRPRLRIDALSARYSGTVNPLGRGQVQVSYVVRNVGNVRLGGRQTVSVSGLIGSWGPAAQVDLPLLIPGQSAHVTTVVRDVWPEIWMRGTVRVSALGLASDVNPPVRLATASVHFWAVPWTLILLVVLVLLGLVLRRGLRRSRPDPGGDPLPGPPLPAPAPAAAPVPVPSTWQPDLNAPASTWAVTTQENA